MTVLLDLPEGAADEFDQFWKEYPRKRAKPAARRAFLKARRDTSFQVILAGLRAFSFDARVQFVPHPASWLNQRRWEDAVDADPSLDPWGLRAWFDAQQVSSESLFSVRGYEFEAIEEILVATGLEKHWRGDLSTLESWLVGGYRPDSLALVIAEVAATAPSPPRRLAFFDRSVRKFALRWNVHRGEWVRG